jgi:plasmid stabilization system protein ParE
MSLEVKLTRRAALDVGQTFNWLVENRSVEVAIRWRVELESAIRSLATEAPACAEAPEAEWLGADIRQFLHGRQTNAHRILFRIRGNTVQVLRIRHARQDLLGPDDL